MAIYSIGDIIRMKREALHITREKLCEMTEEACSVQTLYRIEYGKVKVKPALFIKLMECMGELPERDYASILVKDYRDLTLKSEIDTHVCFDEYEQAEKKLEELSQKIDNNYIRNRQYLMEKKATIDYEQERIQAKEYEEIMFEVLRCTIPSLDKIDIEDWPYNEEEIEILFYICGAYYMMGLREKEMELLQKLRKNVERRYMEDDYYVVWHSLIVSNIALLMRKQRNFEETKKYCIQGIKECKNQEILGSIGKLYIELALSTLEDKGKEGLTKEERESCKELLVQSYYLSIAQRENFRTQWIKEVCETYYPGEIILF